MCFLFQVIIRSGMDVANIVEVVTEPEVYPAGSSRLTENAAGHGHVFLAAAGQCMNGAPAAEFWIIW